MAACSSAVAKVGASLSGGGEEEAVHPIVRGHLRVEGGGEHAALADEDGLAPPAREDLDRGARRLQPRGADEHAAHGAIEARGVELRLERLRLTPVPVALHHGVEEPQARLGLSCAQQPGYFLLGGVPLLPGLLRQEEALARLPEEQRSAVALVLIEGLSYKEAAHVMQVPVGTLTSRLARGREALQEMLGDS